MPVTVSLYAFPADYTLFLPLLRTHLFKSGLKQIQQQFLFVGQGCDDLVISVLDSGLSGPGLNPSWGPCILCSWTRHLTLVMPLSTQVHKWVLMYLIARGGGGGNRNSPT